MIFTFTIPLFEQQPYDEDKKPIETFTGEVEAQEYGIARKSVWVLIMARVNKIRAGTGAMIGCGHLQLIVKPNTTAENDMQTGLARATFLNTLKNQLRDITKSLDATGHVFGQSLEATAVKHAASLLLSELAVHGLLPDQAEKEHTNGSF